MKNVTTELLKQIRDELREFKTSTVERLDTVTARLDTTVERLDTTVERLDTTVERLDRLERRQVEAEVRVSTELVSVVAAIHELRDVVVADRSLRRTVDDHEGRLVALEKRSS